MQFGILSILVTEPQLVQLPQYQLPQHIADVVLADVYMKYDTRHLHVQVLNIASRVGELQIWSLSLKQHNGAAYT